MLKAKLVVVGGDAKSAEIPLNLPTVIGRGREVNLTLPHPLVSRQHCELFERQGKLLVRDLQSLNGTYVDNRRITESEILKPDQLLTIGNVTFRAVYLDIEENQIDTEMMSRAETEQHLAPGKSVIEFNEVASSDADSQLIPANQDDSIHSRPTVPGKPKSPAAALASSAEDADPNDSANEKGTQHSVCAAMLDAGIVATPSDATLSEIQNDLPEPDDAAVSNIEHLTHFEEQRPPQVGESFAGIESEQQENENINPEESALGSFIRKLPR